MRFHRSTPERQGINSERLLDFYREVTDLKHELHSFMLVKNGYVISECWWKPYEAWLPHQMFSLSKSFTSTAVGIASDEGLLSVDDKLVKFFPEELSALEGKTDAKLGSMTVKHLLTMSTGHTYEPWPEEWKGFVNAFLSGAVEKEPGGFFMYNTAATFMLSAVIQKVTGQTLTEFLTPRLYKPLDIGGPYWEKCADGIDFGGFGLNLMTEDIAKFGYLYLHKGMWRGKQLISEAWVEEATRKQVESVMAGQSAAGDWAQGYGYQFWRCTHGAYRGDGAYGQFCVVMPEADSVIAITGNADMQTTLNLIWKHLHPHLTNPDIRMSEKYNVFDSDSYIQLLAMQHTMCVPGYDPHAKVMHIPKTHPFAEKPRHEYKISMEGTQSIQAITKISLEYCKHRHEMLLSLWIGDENLPHMFVYKPGHWTDAISPMPYGPHMARAKIYLDWQENGRLKFINRYIQTPFTMELNLELNESAIKGGLELDINLQQLKLPLSGVINIE